MTSDADIKQPTPEQIEDCKRRLRLEIAQDVIDQLPNTHVQRGRFCISRTTDDLESILGDAADTQTQARALRGNCNVCALGAVFISLLGKRGNFDWRLSHKNRHGVLPSKLAERLKSTFSTEQLLLIENAFECGRGSAAWDEGRREVFGCEEDFDPTVSTRFGNQFPGDNDRLKAIMKNIISNGGQFIPTKGAHAISE